MLGCGKGRHRKAYLVGEILETDHEKSRAKVKLLNGDIFEDVAMMPPLGSNEVIEGYIQVRKGVIVVIEKGYGSDWLIIGELSQGSNSVPSGKSKSEILLEKILDAIYETQNCCNDIATSIQHISAGLTLVATGVVPSGGGSLSTAGKISGIAGLLLSDASKITSDGVKIANGADETKPRFED